MSSWAPKSEKFQILASKSSLDGSYDIPTLPTCSIHALQWLQSSQSGSGNFTDEKSWFWARGDAWKPATRNVTWGTQNEKIQFSSSKVSLEWSNRLHTVGTCSTRVLHRLQSFQRGPTTLSWKNTIFRSGGWWFPVTRKCHRRHPNPIEIWKYLYFRIFDFWGPWHWSKISIFSCEEEIWILDHVPTR